MFFDRLLKLQTLKFRLLGTTSFAQLYSAERLPLRKFRKEGAMLSPLIAGLLAACGGGGGGRDTIDGGKGSDRLIGGDGADIFQFTGKRFGKDFIKDFENIDEIKLKGFRDDQLNFEVNVKADEHVEFIIRFTTTNKAKISEETASITLENLNGVDLTRIQIFDMSGKLVPLDLMDFRTGDDALTAKGNLPVSLYGRGGKDTLTATSGPSYLFGGDGNDILIGGSNSDVLYGDAGRDILTGNGDADIFVVQKIAASDIAESTGSLLSKFYDFAHDFELGTDRIGLPGFGRIKMLAVENDYDFSVGRDDYLADVKKRADERSQSEVSIVLRDLGYRFQKLRPIDEFKRDEDAGKLFWTLIDKRGTEATNDDTALLMFRSDALSSENFQSNHPFSDMDASSLFEFL